MKYTLEIKRDENGRIQNCTLFYNILSFINIARVKGKILKLKK